MDRVDMLGLPFKKEPQRGMARSPNPISGTARGRRTDPADDANTVSGD